MDMGELSDSASTTGSLPNSRPVTPNADVDARTRTRSLAKPRFEADAAQSHPYTLAVKLQKILGLQPDTLAYAKAALEHARDEVRRTSGADGIRAGSPQSTAPTSSWRTGGRLRKQSSMNDMTTFGVGEQIEKGVGLKVGGKKEEEMRERRRRATDGLIYWQKEVARLETGAGFQ